MNDSQPIVPWLRHLSRMIPPSGVVLVGAGRGTGEWVEFLSGLPDTMSILVEADPVEFRFLESMVSGRPAWRFHNQVISKEAGLVDFHETSISSENSLVAPEQLREFWPNLTARQVVPRQAIALDEILSGVEVNWLLVDCLPALPLIEGASAQLGGIDVMVARVVLSTTAAGLHAASLQALQDSLEQQGFHLQAVEPSRHPSLGHALFVRADCFGSKGVREQLLHAEARIGNLLEEITRAKSQIETLTDEKARAEKEAAERMVRLESLEKSNLELTECQKRMEEEIAETKSQIETLTDEKARAEKEVAGRMVRLEEELTGAKSQIETLADEKSRAEKEAVEKLTRLHALRKSNAELMERQKRMDEEIGRTKIQIGLLEKLFCREHEK